MMERKFVLIKLDDGLEYKFHERTRGDIDVRGIQEKIRAEKFSFIRANVPEEEYRLPLLIAEMRNDYHAREITSYIMSHPDEMYTQAYASFKEDNPQVTFEQFKKLIPENRLFEIISIIQELENPKKKNIQTEESPGNYHQTSQTP